MAKVTVLGGCGAWPTTDQSCSGYLVEHDGCRLFVDPGYATFPALQRYLRPDDVDAVLVTHGHPDHCADLNPLLRARALRDVPAPPLPVYAPPGALDAVLTLDRPGMLADSLDLVPLSAGGQAEVGPFTVHAVALPHFVPNLGLRFEAGGAALAYTGDTGPSDAVVDLARDADLLLCEATYSHEVPAEDAEYLTSAVQAGGYASRAGVGQLVLTHLWPGTDPTVTHAAARSTFPGPIAIASPGLQMRLL